MKVSKALRSAKESLNESNWLKNSYFNLRGDVVCMCAHGAVQAQINERVIAALAKTEAVAASTDRQRRAAIAPANAAAMGRRTAERAAEEAEATAAATARITAEKAAWAVRSSAAKAATVAEEVAAARPAEAAAVRVVDVPFTPLWALGLEAHSYLGHVGLTADFNDLPETEFADVIKKFEQAILLAEANGD